MAVKNTALPDVVKVLCNAWDSSGFFLYSSIKRPKVYMGKLSPIPVPREAMAAVEINRPILPKPITPEVTSRLIAKMLRTMSPLDANLNVMKQSMKTIKPIMIIFNI